MALRGGDAIDVADLNLAPVSVTFPTEEAGEVVGQSLQDYLDHVERQALLEALNKTRFNRTAAAKLLGVTFRSLRYRMERLGLND